MAAINGARPIATVTATSTSRRQGLNASAALKVPCKAVSTTALTLSGEQTVNGVACVAGDRVLYALTGGSVDAGIWDVSTGAWTRAKDWDGALDVVTGTIVGVINSGFYEVTTTGTILPGTTSVAFQTSVAIGNFAAQIASIVSAVYGANLVGFRPDHDYGANTAGEALQYRGVVPSDFAYLGNFDPTGVLDSTTVLQAWAASPYPKVGHTGGKFKVSGRIAPVLTNNRSDIDWRGMILDASAGGTFTNSEVVGTAGTLTQIADLSVSPALGARSLTFGSAHGRAQADVFIIYNSTDSSWSSTFAYARAGEFCRVQFATSATVLKTTGGLRAAYTTGANLDTYAMTEHRVNWSNLTVIAPNAGSIRPIQISRATRVRLTNVEGMGSDYVGVSLDRCYDVEMVACNTEVNVQAAASKYGLSIGNCQGVRVKGGEYNAVRHSINIGGDDFVCVVPNRDIRISGAILRNDSALCSVPAADIHANCEGVVYESCTIDGGGSFGGKDASYIDCDFIGADTSISAMIVGGSHWLGGIAKVTGCRFIASGAYANGIVRVVTTDTNTIAATHMIVHDCIVSMGACDTFARADIANLTLDTNADIKGITFLDSASLSNVLRMSGPGSAVGGAYCVVDDITNAKVGATLLTEVNSYTATKVRLMRQKGLVNVTPVAGTPNAGANVTFPLSYGSRTPIVTVQHRAGTVNSLAITSYPSGESATGCAVNIRTGSNANLGVTTPDVSCSWTAELAEV
jgi:uncharacterized cupin superfamily protein